MNNDTLEPIEAAYIATNSYFTLKDWLIKDPHSGMESKPGIENRVIGDAKIGNKDHVPSSLATTKMAGSKLGNIHAAQTGLSTTSGFGYTLTYEGDGRRHIVIATRGTRPEMGFADVFTDLRAGYTNFGDYGLVHKGFKRTFDSIMPNINRDIGKIKSADVLHCVGHSLGGGVATLIAAHFAKERSNVKLYTFGCPRVGCLDTHLAIQKKIRPENIYRVAHDLDPVTMIAPYPYIHLQPSPGDINFMTIISPTGKLLSTANHDMKEYIKSVEAASWEQINLDSKSVDFDNSILARWLLHDENNPGWVTNASVQTLSYLFKLFSAVLKEISTSLILHLTAVDLLAEILLKGMYKLKSLGVQIFQLLKYAAVWAGIKAVEAADFTAEVIRVILGKMLYSLKTLVIQSIQSATRNILPIGLALTGAGVLATASTM